MELDDSLNSTAPAMAAWAGLGDGPRIPHRLPGFTRFQVRLFDI